MSKQSGVSNVNDSNLVDENQSQENEGQNLVKYDSYAKALSQLKNTQSKARDLEAQLSEFKAKEEQSVRERMEADKKFQELYQKERSEKESMAKALEATKSEFTNTRKLAALNQAVGGVKRSEYWEFANLDSIEIGEDGRIVAESLEKEAQRYRSEYSDLLKSASAPTLPAQAPKENVETKPKSNKDVLSKLY